MYPGRDGVCIMANSFHFNGVDLSGSTYGLTVLKTDLPYISNTEVDVTNIPYSYGGVSNQSFLNAEDISFDAQITGTSAANLQTKLDALALLFFQRRQLETTLKFDALSDRYWKVRIVSRIPRSPRGLVDAVLPLNFVAPDPRAFSVSDTSQSESIVTDPDVFPFPAAGNIAGTSQADPIWYIRNQTGGAVTSITLANAATSDTITWTGSLSSGFWLKINTDQRIQLVQESTASGSDPTALSFNDSMTGVTGTFPVFEAGQSNSMTVTGISTGTLRADYTVRF